MSIEKTNNPIYPAQRRCKVCPQSKFSEKGHTALLEVVYLHRVKYDVEFNCFLKTYIVIYLAGIRQRCQYSQRCEQQESAEDVRLLRGW